MPTAVPAESNCRRTAPTAVRRVQCGFAAPPMPISEAITPAPACARPIHRVRPRRRVRPASSVPGRSTAVAMVHVPDQRRHLVVAQVVRLVVAHVGHCRRQTMAPVVRVRVRRGR